MIYKQFLTEKVLKECWHESESSSAVGKWAGENIIFQSCLKCHKIMSNSCQVNFQNRTFDNILDLYALYEAVERDGKWTPLNEYLLAQYSGQKWYFDCKYMIWLFCLNQSDQIEERCKMVASFYGWEAEK